ncbi:MAG: CpXC domain-containing protein [Acutalibacteraceae bacterium]|nr:CpXC domain-containing protein [Acutalibacteraceae bacterium]
MKDKANVQCRKCGKTIEVNKWSAVNGDKNPDLKEKILSGELFSVRCRSCGAVSQLGYPMVYSDPTKNIMIWLVFDDEEVGHIKSYYKTCKTQPDENGKTADKECRLRIVRNSFQLREKIMIADCGLDDKIVELAKLAYAKSAQQKNSSDKIAVSFFSSEGGNNRIEMYCAGGKAFVSVLSADIIKKLEDKYGGKASYAEDRVYIIDDVWALELVRQYEAEH